MMFIRIAETLLEITYLFPELCRFLWRRDSESAVVLIIVVSAYLDRKDTHETAEYLEALKANRAQNDFTLPS